MYSDYLFTIKATFFYIFFFFISTSLLLPTHLPSPSCTHAQSCNPMNCSPPGSSVHGLFQARILEWVAISFFIYIFLSNNFWFNSISLIFFHIAMYRSAFFFLNKNELVLFKLLYSILLCGWMYHSLFNYFYTDGYLFRLFPISLLLLTVSQWMSWAMCLLHMCINISLG